MKGLQMEELILMTSDRSVKTRPVVPESLTREVEAEARQYKTWGYDKDTSIALLADKYKACPYSMVVIIVSGIYS